MMEARLTEVGGGDVGVSQQGPMHVSRAQLRFREIRIEQLRVFEQCVIHTGVGELGALQPRRRQVGALKVSAKNVDSNERGPGRSTPSRCTAPQMLFATRSTPGCPHCRAPRVSA
jgi:hypothetical protein